MGADGSVPGAEKGGRRFLQGGGRGRGNRKVELSRADRTIRSSRSGRERGEMGDEDVLKTELAE